jgi:hypothetical protein
MYKGRGSHGNVGRRNGSITQADKGSKRNQKEGKKERKKERKKKEKLSFPS